MAKKYKYQPKTREELIEAIKKEIYEVQGTPDNPNWEADLNCIDTSQVTDMSCLFKSYTVEVETGNNFGFELERFRGDISEWDVSNVENMDYMFAGSLFDNDISGWNVYRVRSMKGMFAESFFNRDIGEWNVSNVEDMYRMFEKSRFNKNISDWNVSRVKDMRFMFYGSKFNQPIGNWNVSSVKNMSFMFAHSRFNQDISRWNISNVEDMAYMFAKSEFSQSLFKWGYRFNDKVSLYEMFSDSKFNGDITSWYYYLDDKEVEDTELKNLSVYCPGKNYGGRYEDTDYLRLPDKIEHPFTLFKALAYNYPWKEIQKRLSIEDGELCLFEYKKDEKVFPYFMFFYEEEVPDYIKINLLRHKGIDPKNIMRKGCDKLLKKKGLEKEYTEYLERIQDKI